MDDLLFTGQACAEDLGSRAGPGPGEAGVGREGHPCEAAEAS